MFAIHFNDDDLSEVRLTTISHRRKIEPEQAVTFVDATIGNEKNIASTEHPNSFPSKVMYSGMYHVSFFFHASTLSINMSLPHKICKITFLYNSMQQFS